MDISSQESKTLNRYLGEPFDYVVTVCDEANEACPFFRGAAKRLHWSLPDPAVAGGDGGGAPEVPHRRGDAKRVRRLKG
jgi:arsenate reductase (thioredoxin)